jgi:hypothetical protein
MSMIMGDSLDGRAGGIGGAGRALTTNEAAVQESASAEPDLDAAKHQSAQRADAPLYPFR